MAMKKIVFEETAFQHFTEWATINKKLHQRIVALDILRQPYSGIGKPEALKHDLSKWLFVNKNELMMNIV